MPQWKIRIYSSDFSRHRRSQEPPPTHTDTRAHALHFPRIYLYIYWGVILAWFLVTVYVLITPSIQFRTKKCLDWVYWLLVSLGWLTGEPLLLVSFWTGQIHQIRLFSFPAWRGRKSWLPTLCEVCRRQTGTEVWCGSELMFNPCIFGMAQYPPSQLYLVSPCPGPSLILYLEIKLSVLWMGWGKFVGRGGQLPGHIKWWRRLGDLITF